MAVARDRTNEVLQQFEGFVARHDVAAIETAMRVPLVYGGLWFTDPECTRKFPVAGVIKADRIHAFATCLVQIEMHSSVRKDALLGIGVVDVEPGFEVEIAFRFAAGATWIRWIGFSGRRDLADALPTVQPEALEGNRLEGERAPVPSPAIQQALDANIAASDRKFEYAWLKICLDAEGSITSVTPREVTSEEWLDFVQRSVAQWKFKPFMVGHQALPVCVHERLDYPRGVASDGETFPLVYSGDAHGPIIIPASRLKRVEGEKNVTPDDSDKTLIARAGGGTLVASFKLCVDVAGAVTDVTMLESSGLASYDAKIVRAIKTWRYEPVSLKGKPTAVCSGIRFVYSQS